MSYQEWFPWDPRHNKPPKSLIKTLCWPPPYTQLTCLRTTTTVLLLYSYQALKSNKLSISPIWLWVLSAQFHSFSYTNLKCTCSSILCSLQQNWNPEGTSAFSPAAHACPAMAQITTSIQMYSQMAGPETNIWMQEFHLGGKPRKQSEGMREAQLIKAILRTLLS